MVVLRLWNEVASARKVNLMETRDKLIGANLRRLIDRRDISQKKVAELAKISETTLSRALKGSQGLQQYNLDAVLRVLGATIADVTAPIGEHVDSEKLAAPPSISAESIALYIGMLEEENKSLKERLAKYESSQAPSAASVEADLSETLAKAKERIEQLEGLLKSEDHMKNHQKYRSTKAQDFVAEIVKELETAQSIKNK